MTRLVSGFALAAAAALAACGRGADQRPDAGLQNDLSLAAQAQPYAPQQYMSPVEQGTSSAPYGPPASGAPRQYQAVERTPYAYQSAPRPVVRRTSSPAPAGSTGGGYGAEPVRNTQRDAAIGAAAGAILGASTSRDKLKGAVVGAAAGAVLGGIFGHTVDVDHRP
jgi:hypothetical protein